VNNEKKYRRTTVKKTTTIIILFLGFFLFAAGVSASPQMNRRSGRYLMRSNTERLLDVLKARQDEFKITDEQIKKIEELTFHMEDKALKLRSDIASTQLELRRQMRDVDNRDYEKIKSLMVKSAELRADMFKNRMTLRDDIRNILTPEQRAAIKEMASKAQPARRFMKRRAAVRRDIRRERPFFRR
jgi:Spy/CpxP family protein refolding chaperone